MTKARISYEKSLDYYGNTLWKLKEHNVEKIHLIKTNSLFDRLFSLIFVDQREVRINENEFDSYHSLLKRFLNKFSNKKHDLLQQITNTEKRLNQLQKRFNTKNIYNSCQFENPFNNISLNNDGKYKKFFEVISRIISDNFRNLQNIKFKLEKLKENNIVIGYIFIKLESDFIRILKDRDFNHDEYEQISAYLSTIRYNRNRFLNVAGLSVK